uniref:Uncharacterized protein n=1 Tax=Avena sativa TaxID=4498 RepID=A0ACD5ZWU1_AVESA
MTIPTSLLAASLNPPSITALDASGGALPCWVLLETRVYSAHRDDSTAASAKTSRDEHEIVVSICFADPPALSHVCLHCPSLSTTNFVGEPHVVRSHEQFLLLHLPLTWPTSGIPKRSDEYYMYQVTQTQGKKKKPTLSRIPNPKPCLLLRTDLGIYCPADAPGEYILAGLCPTLNAETHELHLYSSKPHKVIPLGGSLLGWVDLWKGILVCDVLSSYRVVFLRFVPFPGRLPGNTTCHLCPWKVRDFACANGSLKFVEIEHFPEPSAIEKTVAEDPPDIVYDDPPSVEGGA